MFYGIPTDPSEQTMDLGSAGALQTALNFHILSYNSICCLFNHKIIATVHFIHKALFIRKSQSATDINKNKGNGVNQHN